MDTRESIFSMKLGACGRFAAVVMACAVARSASAMSWEWRLTVEEPDGSVAVVTSEAPRGDIEVVLEPVKTADGWDFTGRIANNGKGLVTSFEGPIIKGLPVDKARSGFYVPEGFGRRVSNFAQMDDSDDKSKWRKVAEGEFTYETYVYPSRKLTMPWVAIDDGISGASVMVLDSRANAKSFSLRYRPESDKAAIVPKHLVFIAPGQIWKLPTVSYVRYQGDWHVAARKYRAWYDTVHKATAFPAWTKQVNGWLLVILKQQNEEIFWPYGDFGKLADYADSLGLDMIGLFGWTVGGHDHLYPDYEPCPKMGGRDALVEGIKLLKKRGKRVCLYANGQLQHVGATRYWNEYGKDHSLIRKDGGLVIQHYHKYSDIPNYDQALACLYSKPWFDRMLSLARNAKNLGADAILYDQLGVSGPYACYGKGHGHPVPAYSYAEERVGFLDRIADEMRAVDPDFVVMTEGIHDTIMDSIAFWHGISYCASRDSCESFMKSRGNGRNPGNEWPELVRYTFPELATTVRVPTPIVDRPMVNYTVVFGMRHDVELRYGPDRIYAETGNVTTNYGTVIRVPNFAILKSESKGTLAGYMKAVSDFQHANSDLLLEGRFVDTDGFTFAGKGCIAKRFIGEKGSGVIVWNISAEPAAVNVGGLGKPQSVTEPEAGAVAPDAPLVPDTIRLYRFADIAF